MKRRALGGAVRVIFQVAVIALAAFLAACHAGRILAPPPPLRVASAALYAVDVEFAEPLDRVTASDPSHYRSRLSGSATPATITSATLVDTLYGRVVQLVIPEWLGVDSDTMNAQLSTSGVLAADGRSTGTRQVTFRTGLSYAGPLRALFETHCSSCHNANRADGSYRTDSYAALLGGGTNATPNLVVGDPACLLVRKSRPRNSMFDLGGLSYLDYELLQNWVASYSARQ